MHDPLVKALLFRETTRRKIVGPVDEMLDQIMTLAIEVQELRSALSGCLQAMDAASQGDHAELGKAILTAHLVLRRSENDLVGFASACYRAFYLCADIVDLWLGDHLKDPLDSVYRRAKDIVDSVYGIPVHSGRSASSGKKVE